MFLFRKIERSTCQVGIVRPYPIPVTKCPSSYKRYEGALLQDPVGGPDQVCVCSPGTRGSDHGLEHLKRSPNQLPLPGGSFLFHDVCWLNVRMISHKFAPNICIDQISGYEFPLGIVWAQVRHGRTRPALDHGPRIIPTGVKHRLFYRLMNFILSHAWIACRNQGTDSLVSYECCLPKNSQLVGALYHS